MKKNLLTVAAMAVVAFFVSTEIAKAADISLSGNIRTRWEVNEQGNNGGNGTGTTNSFNNNPDDFINSSVRLNATANINETTSAFIQMQSVRTWGEGAGASNVGSGNSSATVSDGDASVGVHQAYFTFKNFGHLPLAMDAKIGKQEIILDGHRLFGNTIWTMGMQSHDAVRLTHAHDNMTLNLGYILGKEDGRTVDGTDAGDRDVYLAHLNLKGVLGGAFSGYFVYDQNTAANGAFMGDNEVLTIGGRQVGNLMGLDYRAEYYHQFGSADSQLDAPLDGQTFSRVTANSDRNAYMFGIRVGKSFKNVGMKPSLTFWYDYLSGTSDADQRNSDWSSFNTVFDTGHKFYGLIDVFLGVGGGTGTGTQGLGLRDTAIKAKLSPMPGWTVKMDYHWFSTAESVAANTNTRGFANAQSTGDSLGNNLGTELDITAVNKFNANTKMMIGYSNFNPSESFVELKNGGNGSTPYGSQDANWAYVMFDVKF